MATPRDERILETKEFTAQQIINLIKDNIKILSKEQLISLEDMLMFERWDRESTIPLEEQIDKFDGESQ